MLQSLVSTSACLLSKFEKRSKPRAGAPNWTITPLALALGMVLASAWHNGARAQLRGDFFTQQNAALQQQQRAAHQAARAVQQSLSTQQQQAAARAHLSHSLDNLNRTANAIAAQQAAQNAARLAARQQASSVADGLAQGGLEVATGDKATWLGAQAPVTSSKDGQHHVGIKQTESKAILHWNRFDVGRNTTVEFQQKSTDAVLNRVVGVDAKPSQIQGKIKGDGTVMVVNQNGIIFSGSSQVNVRNLVAAAASLSDQQFFEHGILGAEQGKNAVFNDAKGDVRVEAGALLAPLAPHSSTREGGYVLLLGQHVHHAGEIQLNQGQAVLAAGDTFYIRQGRGSEANRRSSIEGLEVAAHAAADQSHTLTHTGVIQGNSSAITLHARQVQVGGDKLQAPALTLSTSTTQKRGTIHVLGTQDTDSQVELLNNSVTAIVIDQQELTALDSQRDSLRQHEAQYTDNTNEDRLRDPGAVFGAYGSSGRLNVESRVNPSPDRLDQSRIEIISGGNIHARGGALVLATGGQLVFRTAPSTTNAQVGGVAHIHSGAALDVSGAIGVALSMSDNNLLINVQGNELRDAPVNRDSNARESKSWLSNSDLWLDERLLVPVLGLDGEYRLYSHGGLLEVSGWVGLRRRGMGEWASSGGNISAYGARFTSDTGALLNLSGGTLDVASGSIRQSWLLDGRGRLHLADRALATIPYTRVFTGYVSEHHRWGASSQREFHSPLLAPYYRYEQGYTVGRDAGELIVATQHFELQGQLIADTYQSPLQQLGRVNTQGNSHHQLAQRAGLIIGHVVPMLQDGALVSYVRAVSDQVHIHGGDTAQPVNFDIDDWVFDANSSNKLSADLLNDWNLGKLLVAANEAIVLDGDLRLAPSAMGGESTTLGLHAPQIVVNAAIYTPAGGIVMNNRLTGRDQQGKVVSDERRLPLASHNIKPHFIHVGAQGDLNTSGVINLSGDSVAKPYLEGGDIHILSSGYLRIQKGAKLVVNSGAMLDEKGQLQGGYGGDVHLASGYRNSEATFPSYLEGHIEGYGVKGGGSLRVDASTAVSIGGRLLQENGVLKAGEVAPTMLTIEETIEQGEGEILLADITYKSNVLMPGQYYDYALMGGFNTAWVNGWPSDMYVTEDFYFFEPLKTVQGVPITIAARVPGDDSLHRVTRGWLRKGTQILGLSARPANQVLPPEVFSVPIPVTNNYDKVLSAGILLTAEVLNNTLQGKPVVITPGNVIAAGQVLGVDVKVTPLFEFSTARFNSGFAHYDIRGAQGLRVAASHKDGETLQPTQPLWQLEHSSGTISLQAKQRAQLLQAPKNAYDAATFRPGVQLSFSAGLNGGDTQNRAGLGITIDENVTLQLDPLQTLSLHSAGFTRIDGKIVIPGGVVEFSDSVNNTLLQRPAQISPAAGLGVQLGKQAHIDVAGRAFKVHNAAQNKAYGLVLDGGQVLFGQAIERETGRGYHEYTPSSLHGFVAIAEGALVDASGAALYDSQGALVQSSRGGRIVLNSTYGWQVDGELLAHGGKATQGGSLELALESPSYRRDNAYLNQWLHQRELNLVQKISDITLSNYTVGRASYSVQQLAEGGFSSVALLVNGALSLQDGLHLDLGDQLSDLSLYTRAMHWTDDVGSQATASIKAPYLLLAGTTYRSSNPDGTSQAPVGGISVPGRSEWAQGSISFYGQHIDLRDHIYMGRHEVGSNLTKFGFKQINLLSDTDVRISSSGLIGGGSVNAGLTVPYELNIYAQRTYVSSGTIAILHTPEISWIREKEGYIDGTSSPSEVGSSINFYASPKGKVSSATPNTYGGRLAIGAEQVRVASAIYAPEGQLLIGLNKEYGAGDTERVHLEAGAIVSVSTAGLVIPNGGTTDGLTWEWASGETFTAHKDDTRRRITKNLRLAGSYIKVDDGVTLDVSGGGELLGYGFIAGRGGSRDIRYHALDPFQRVLQRQNYKDYSGIYAVLPANDLLAPATHSAMGADFTSLQFDHALLGLSTTQSYTLMPAEYALLPGAIRVELVQQPHPWVVTDAPDVSLARHDGLYSNAGSYRSGATLLGGINGHVLNSHIQVLLTPAAVAHKHANYNQTTFTQYLEAAALLHGVMPERGIADAGVLQFTLNNYHHYINGQWLPVRRDKASLQFEGQINAQSQGGYLAEAAVNTHRKTMSLTVVSSELPLMPPSSNTAFLLTDAALNQIASSVYHLRVGVADRANDAAHTLSLATGVQLHAQELLLGADQSLQLADGVTITARHQGTLVPENYQARAIHGDVTALLISERQQIGASFGTGGGQIRVGEAVLQADGVVAFMTDGEVTLNPRAQIGAKELQLKASAITLYGSEQNADNNRYGLQLDSHFIHHLLHNPLIKIQKLHLAASDFVGFHGNVQLNLQQEGGLGQFLLSTPTLKSVGHNQANVEIHADEFQWASPSYQESASIVSATDSSGQFIVNAQTVLLGQDKQQFGVSKTPVLRAVGFDNYQLQAEHAIQLAGDIDVQFYQRQKELSNGKLSYQDGSLTLVTPQLSVAAGVAGTVAAHTIHIQGNHAANPSKANDLVGLGGSLALHADAQLHTQNVYITLPTGKVLLQAGTGLNVGENTLIDVAAVPQTIGAQDVHLWGGEVELRSQRGYIHTHETSSIDVSAMNNHAGQLRVILEESEGTKPSIRLNGAWAGQAVGNYASTGQEFAYAGGRFSLQAPNTEASGGSASAWFTELNRKLDEAGFFGARLFAYERGDLVVSDTVTANIIDLQLRHGQLTINGTLDASGDRVGRVTLQAQHGLSLGDTATIDVSSHQLRVDAYGDPIHAANRGRITLGSESGTVRIGNSHFNFQVGGDSNYRQGALHIYAPRLQKDGAGVRLRMSAGATQQGAAEAVVYGVARYTDAPLASEPLSDGKWYQQIDQSYMDRLHQDSNLFIERSLADTGWRMDALAVQNQAIWQDIMHLRPAVQIESLTAETPLVVIGDIDLARYRYASLNPEVASAYQTGVDSSHAAYGSGEPGLLMLKGKSDVYIFGSINDGFAMPVDPATGSLIQTPDDDNWLLVTGTQPLESDVWLPINGVTLEAGTVFPKGVQLNYTLGAVAPVSVAQGVVLPIAGVTIAAYTFSTTVAFNHNVEVQDTQGVVHTILAGQRVPAGSILPAGSELKAGSRLPIPLTLQFASWPANTPLISDLTLDAAQQLSVGAFIPGTAKLVLPSTLLDGTYNLRPSTNGEQRINWAAAPMLGEGKKSWSIHIGAGENALAGKLVLSDPHYSAISRVVVEGAYYTVQLWDDELGGYYYTAYMAKRAHPGQGMEIGKPMTRAQVSRYCGTPASAAVWCDRLKHPDSHKVVAGSPLVSVLRTGTGDIQLNATSDININSAYGVYTAGAEVDLKRVASVDNAYALRAFNRENYRDVGRSVLGAGGVEYEHLVNEGSTSALRTGWYSDGGGDVSIHAGKDLLGWSTANTLSYNTRATRAALEPDVWLWTQGLINDERWENTSTGWKLNFGTYVGPGNDAIHDEALKRLPYFRGFTGVGTLGGGNVAINVGRHFGAIQMANDSARTTGRGVTAAAASTGIVHNDGRVQQMGGGDVSIIVGGRVNPVEKTEYMRHVNFNHYGAVIAMRGQAQLQAFSVGAAQPFFHGSYNLDSRPVSDDLVYTLQSAAGLNVFLADAALNINSYDGLTVSGIADIGRRAQGMFALRSRTKGERIAEIDAQSVFSLWTDYTSVRFSSAGGDLIPFNMQVTAPNWSSHRGSVFYAASNETGFILPSQMAVLAASGSVYLGSTGFSHSNSNSSKIFVSAPNASQGGSFMVQAKNMVSARDFILVPSNAAHTVTSGPKRAPVWVDGPVRGLLLSTMSNNTLGRAISEYFAFGPLVDHNSGTTAASVEVYAEQGDIIGLDLGATFTARGGEQWLAGPSRASISAGRDLVSFGRGADTVFNTPMGAIEVKAGLLVHDNAQTVSTLYAGRDLLHSQVQIAGPGTLALTAGRSIRMEDRVSVTSLGGVVPADERPGADIVMLAGVGQNGPAYQQLLQQYTQSSNRIDTSLPLADQPGGVVQDYEAELIDWLAERFDYQAEDAEAAREYLAALPTAQQGVFARQIYFNELRAGGREYNDRNGPRFGSYLRGRNVIEALFPTLDSHNNPIVYEGGVTIYGNQGVHTLRGGNIQILSPGGAQVFGVEGIYPSGAAGVITQGQGDIQLFARDSILLGQSRIMTTFGGDILAWSAQGDINAGRGSKTTVVYAPPRRVYDEMGNVSINPDVPSTGAGIATLAPIPEVPAGDVDLIAPLGTIDAGEAGIRVSGNVNVAALHVVNADNIQVQGESKGMPIAVSVNVGALTSASSAANSAATAAQETLSRARDAARSNQPSQIQVQILGFGAGDSTSSLTPARVLPSTQLVTEVEKVVDYDPEHAVRILSFGAPDNLRRLVLSEHERRNLGL